MIFQKSILITILAVAAVNAVNAGGQQVLRRAANNNNNNNNKDNEENNEQRQLSSLFDGLVLVINTNKYGFEEHETQADYCGGHLSSVHSDEELREIQDIFDAYATNAHSLYLGLEYVGDEWAWTDGTDLDYENWDDQSQSTDGYVIRGRCKSSECKFSSIPRGFLFPAVYRLPEDYMSIAKYPNCDINSLYELN